MKTVLIITNVFPPFKGVGRHRIIQFAKYLPKNGWKPIILAPTYSYLWKNEMDIKTLQEIPKSLIVYRAYLPPTIPVCINNIVNKYGRKKLCDKKSSLIYNFNSIRKSNWIKKFLVSIVNSFQNFLDLYILIPGKHIFWIPFSLIKAIRIIKLYKIDIIITSAPAYTNHIIGYCLKLITRITWIADYRDLWSGDHTRYWLPIWREKLEKNIESWLLRRIDGIIVVSKQMIQIMKMNFHNLKNEKFSIIPNGFDTSYLSVNSSTYTKNSDFNIVYTGQIGKSTNSKFFYAVNKIVNENRDISKCLIVTFVGRITPSEKEEIVSKLKGFKSQLRLQFTGWVPHSQALKIQGQADVLLLVVSSMVRNAKAIVTGKIFEYIIANRPILAIVVEGAAKDVIIETNTGIVAHPDNVEEIKKAILKLYQKWKKNKLYINPNQKIIRQYDRKNLTEKLAKLLNSM